MSLFRFSLRLWRSRFLSRSASSLQTFLLAFSCALLLVVACGGVASADDSIEVISEPETVEVTVLEDVKEDAKEEKAEEQSGKVATEQVKDSQATEDVEETGKEQPMEDTSTEVGEPLQQTRATISLSAYGNVSPTNQYAVYSTGLLKEVPYDGHYVFLQDTNQSYIMVVGKGDSPYSLQDCKWWRWYNAGVNVGWVLERGSGSVSVSAGRYQIISDFDGYPALQENSTEVLRREVSLYALVAAVMHVLYCVWSYELRGAKRSLG